jgi:beta-galactosidase/beta-glucuronidase
MPADWGQSLGADFRGCVRYRRPFHGPTGLTPDLYLKVWLVLEGADARATVTLNGQPLGIVPGPDCQTEFDVTTMLQEQNELIVVVECPACDGDRPLPRTPDRQQRPGGLIGEVRLEIRGQDA